MNRIDEPEWYRQIPLALRKYIRDRNLKARTITIAVDPCAIKGTRIIRKIKSLVGWK
jgi:hypothetical protein